MTGFFAISLHSLKDALKPLLKRKVFLRCVNVNPQDGP
jgi:hypothetical protein